MLSLKSIIKYKGDKDQRLITCGTSDACSTLSSFDGKYAVTPSSQIEYINNQIVYIAEIQWNNK